jgi:hypothetical protein
MRITSIEINPIVEIAALVFHLPASVRHSNTNVLGVSPGRRRENEWAV